MRNLKVSVSRNEREGYYAGYYPAHIHFGKAGHRRWDAWAMMEFYPRINGVCWQERERLNFNSQIAAWNTLNHYETPIESTIIRQLIPT